jgi:hypothetical protein
MGCGCGKTNTNIVYHSVVQEKKENTNCTIDALLLDIALANANTKPRSVKLNIILGKLQTMVNLGDYCKYDINQLNLELDAL